MLSAELKGHSGGSLEGQNAERNAMAEAQPVRSQGWEGGTQRPCIVHSGKEPDCVLKN